MELEITKTIDEQVLENIFVTALEGGSNYWFDLHHDDIINIRRAQPDEPFSIGLFNEVMYNGRKIQVLDYEDNDDIIGELSLESVKRGLEKIMNSGDEWALNNEINEMGDAASSDVVFQYMCLGEAVYG
jgi:hypothetical protein